MKYCKLKHTNTDEVHGLIKAFCEETGADKSAYEEILDRLPVMHIFAAVADGAEGIMGLLGYYVVSDEKVVGDFLYTKPAYRNSSIAGRLNHMAMNHAKEHGATTAAVFTKPSTAQRYTKLGYKEAMYVLEKQI